MKLKKIVGLIGLRRYSEITGISFDTLQSWRKKAIEQNKKLVIKNGSGIAKYGFIDLLLLHGNKLYGNVTYNGVKFVFIYGLCFVDIDNSNLVEKLKAKYNV